MSELCFDKGTCSIYQSNLCLAEKAKKITAVLNKLKQPEYNMITFVNYLVLTDLPIGRHNYGLCSDNATELSITPRASWYAFAEVKKSFV